MGFYHSIEINKKTSKQTNYLLEIISIQISAQAPFATKMMTSYDADDDNGGTRLVLVCELHFCKTMEVVAFAQWSKTARKPLEDCQRPARNLPENARKLPAGQKTGQKTG